MVKYNEVILVVGNHHSLVGCWEQIEITIKTFRTAKIPINLSARIVPNKINIIIEDFNSLLVSEIKKISLSHPETKFILYVTEYLTKQNNLLFLNIFSFKDAFFRIIALIESYIFSDYIDLTFAPYIKKIKVKLRMITRRYMIRIFEKFGKSWDNEVMIARRQRMLFKCSKYFSLCISTTDAVLNGYNKLCSCPLSYLPVFIIKKKALKNRKKNKKLHSFFFSGRMTPYRKEVLRSFVNIKNKYPLTTYNYQPAIAQKDFENKISNLEDGIFGKKIAKNAKLLSKIIKSNIMNYVSIPIYDYLKKDKNHAFEIYIPQEQKWKYSSPNRTLLSIESGFIPVDYGEFKDHDINKLTIDISKIDEFLSLFKNDLNFYYSKLDLKIDKYNQVQERKLKIFKKVFDETFNY